jgi:hypothetical protein
VEAIINVLYGADLREECDKACVVSTGVSLKPMWDRGLSDVKVVDQIGVMCHLTGMTQLPAVFDCSLYMPVIDQIYMEYWGAKRINLFSRPRSFSSGDPVPRWLQ